MNYAACAECCFKHLAAAEAWQESTSFEVLMARAIILDRELQQGYTQNLQVLLGVLSAAEQICPVEKIRPIRHWRKNRMLGHYYDPQIMGIDPTENVTHEDWREANIIEARREAPSPDVWDDIRCVPLEEMARRIAQVYELIPGEANEAQDSEPVKAQASVGVPTMGA